MRIHLTFVLLLSSLLSFAQDPDTDDTTGSDVSNDDAIAILQHHNKARAEVNVPPLVWNAKLAAHAQEWADSLAANPDCKLEHRQKNPYGENIFATSAPRDQFRPVAASEAWYAEKARFTYSRIGEAGSNGTWHYTAMIWKTTTEVGVGMATCANGNTLVVANYNPVGNFSGEYPY